MQRQNKKMAMLIEQDFEDVEVSEPMKAFKNAGLEIAIVGNEAGKDYAGKQKKIHVRSDITPEQVNVQDFDALFIPGGYAPDKMRLHPSMIELVKKFYESSKIIAALCHGPQMLISAGLVKNRRMTSWPSVAVDLRNAGANWVDEPVVSDGPFITSRKPEDIPQFTQAIIEALGRVPAEAK